MGIVMIFIAVSFCIKNLVHHAKNGLQQENETLYHFCVQPSLECGKLDKKEVVSSTFYLLFSLVYWD